MSSMYKCDGCGKEAKAVHYPNGSPGWHKPHDWFQREDKDGIQDACSRKCVETIAAKSGKTACVLPF